VVSAEGRAADRRAAAAVLPPRQDSGAAERAAPPAPAARGYGAVCEKGTRDFTPLAALRRRDALEPA
jgi:hypothetical protein